MMLSSGNNALKTDEGNSSPTILFIIDPQVDFHTGSLKVPGAEEDSVRIAEMIKENMDSIDEIVISLDSHNRNHIAHAVFWKSDSEVPGDSVLEPQADRAPIYRPKAFTQITHKDVNEKWFPVDQSLKEWCKDYTRKLEDKGRFVLTIWPEHCLIGSQGHAVVETIHSQVREWSRRNQKVVHYIFKGSNCLTEMYSAIEAEVVVETDASTTKNRELLGFLRSCAENDGKLIVCGQAMSHCVNYTVRDIAKDWKKKPNTNMKNMVLLENGASCVASFEKAGEDFKSEMAAEGVTITTCENVRNLLTRGGK